MKRRTVLLSGAITGISLALNGASNAQVKAGVSTASMVDVGAAPLPVRAKGKRIRTAFVIGKDARRDRLRRAVGGLS